MRISQARVRYSVLLMADDGKNSKGITIAIISALGVIISGAMSRPHQSRLRKGPPFRSNICRQHPTEQTRLWLRPKRNRQSLPLPSWKHSTPRRNTTPTVTGQTQLSTPSPSAAPPTQTVIAPNGIGNIGGTLMNPTVNNYPPPPAAHLNVRTKAPHTDSSGETVI